MQRIHKMAGVTGLLLALCASAAMAETSKTGSLGTANAKAPIMTRDELRACMQEQDAFKKRADDMKAQRATLDQERTERQAENESIKQERDALQAKIKAASDDFNVKAKAHQDAVAAFNEKMKDANDAVERGDPSAERKRDRIAREGKALNDESEALNAEVAKLKGSFQGDQDALNAKVTAFQTKVDDWNTRNKKLEADSIAYDDDLSHWKRTCGNRRYREDDETAIRKGK